MRTSCARRAASTLNGCAAGVSNSAIMSFSHLPIVERLCVSLGIRAVSFRYRVRNGIAVLHEGAAEHRVQTKLSLRFQPRGARGGSQKRVRREQFPAVVRFQVVRGGGRKDD